MVKAMADIARRRTVLGPQRSAALPLLWEALARLGWSDARLSSEMGTDTAQVSRLVYGDRPANRRQAKWLFEVLSIPLGAWDEPCPVRRRDHQRAADTAQITRSAAA